MTATAFRRAAELACATFLLATAAHAAGPAAPELIYDAAPRQILLDWNYVPKANWYEIWFKANAGAAWAKLGERPSWYPHRDVNVSAHLLDWFGSRWDVRACNPGGCSTPRSINIGSTVVNTIGYVKPQHPQANAAFGAAVDVSEDGKTLAAVAAGERLNAADAASGTATVYVYRGTPNNWKQEARLRPSNAQIGNGAGVTVSLSADGNLLALGIPNEKYSLGGNASAEHGAVYVFRHDSTGWREEARFTGLDSHIVRAGNYTKISDDGNMLAFAYASTNPVGEALQTYRYDGTTWVYQNPLGPEVHDQVDFGMAGNGKVLFIRTRFQDSVEIFAYDIDFHYMIGYVQQNVPAGYVLSSFDVDISGNNVASGVRPPPSTQAAYDPAHWKPTVTVYHTDVDIQEVGGDYRVAAVLTPSVYQSTLYSKRTLFGDRIALSGNASYVAVYDPHDAQSAYGVQPPPSAPYGSQARGSIYLFEKHGTGYRERRHLGANGGTPDYVDGIGIFGQIALGDDGKALVAAAPAENGGIGGIHRSGDAEAHDTSAPDAGAVWLY